MHANEFTSNLFGKPIKDIPLPEGVSIGAVIRNDQLIMPTSEIDLSVNDHLIMF